MTLCQDGPTSRSNSSCMLLNQGPDSSEGKIDLIWYYQKKNGKVQRENTVIESLL